MGKNNNKTNKKQDGAMAGCGQWVKKLLRKKVFSEDDLHRSELRRCLTTLDVIGMGMGGTLGTGVYILSGQVSRQSAGPAVVLSFVIAGLAAGLAGFCYAEFAARVPRAGSAYVYSYVTVGEFMAFVIGWNMLLEYVLCVASLARALSAYMDQVADNRMQQAFERYMPLSLPGLSHYPDFFAFSLVLLATVIVALGVKNSTIVNSVLTVINMVVIALIIICGFSKADIRNWQLSGDELPDGGAGSGGFAPFGVSGIIAGAAVCFFSYVGFDSVASLGEEAEDRRSIPIALGVTVVINTLVNSSVGAVVTLMAPYFLLDVNTPVAFVFERVGWSVAKYVITLGAVCGLSSSMMTPVVPMARVVYAMASDGLIFRCLSTVSPRFRTPFIGTLLCGLFAGILALLFDLSELIDMLSIGTLLAFGLVAVCVLILRYEAGENLTSEPRDGSAVKLPLSAAQGFRLIDLVRPGPSGPTSVSIRIAKISIAVLCMSLVAEAALVNLCAEQLEALSAWSIAMATLLGAVILLSLFIISRQPQNPQPLRFKVPLVPVLPALSCLVNVFLMLKLSYVTWIRFVVWLTIGFCLYFFYGLQHSSLNGFAEERASLVRSGENGACIVPGSAISPYQDHLPHTGHSPHAGHSPFSVPYSSQASDLSASYSASLENIGQ